MGNNFFEIKLRSIALEQNLIFVKKDHSNKYVQDWRDRLEKYSCNIKISQTQISLVYFKIF